MYTDASGTAAGYGGYTVSLGAHIARGHWGPRDSQQRSTYRELKAIYLVIESFTDMLTSKKVKVFTDNQNTARTTIYGTAKLDLHAITVQLYHHGIEHKIFLECQWIPRQGIELLIISVASLT